MIYTVDGNAVNSRTDWSHQPVPRSPQSARVGMFPGVAERFVIRSVAMPGGHVVRGLLEGIASSISAAVASLHSQVEAWSIERATGTLHTVVIHQTTITEAYLEQFSLIGGVAPVRNERVGGGQFGVTLGVEFVWMALK